MIGGGIFLASWYLCCILAKLKETTPIKPLYANQNYDSKVNIKYERSENRKPPQTTRTYIG